MGGPAPGHRRGQRRRGGRLLFRAELGTEAHMGPTGRYDKLRYEAEILAFIVTATGMPAAPDG